MNILKTLRKPYLSIFLASLVLFVSCNKDSLLDDSEMQTQTLDEYISKHIELTSKMSELKNSIDYNIVEKLKEIENKSVETSNLKTILQDENINISDKLFELQLKIIENTKMLYNNPQYNTLNQEEFSTLITNEIKTKFDNELILLQKSNDCDAAFDAANEQCLIDFGASVATVGVVGLFTSFGVGSLIGAGIALIQFGECNESAQADLADCRK